MALAHSKSAAKWDDRLDQARVWLLHNSVDLQSEFFDIAGDASFRRYFRLQADGVSRVLMDAPPGPAVKSFIDIARRLRNAGLHSPEILLEDWRNGFLLLEDLGDDLFRDILDEHSVDTLFPALFKLLKQMALTVDTRDLPEFDIKIYRRDLGLFPEWYLGHHRKSMARGRFDVLWTGFCEQLIASALNQPQCFVHRDFHSCNLLRISADDIGIIDFQDAVRGPVSYDLVSLIWDRYISWPRARIEDWLEEFRLDLGLEIEAAQWLRYCDLMGLQRSLKIAGIFARLYYRDGKTGYIEMIPRFYEHITGTLRHYPEFAELLELLEHDKCVP